MVYRSLRADVGKRSLGFTPRSFGAGLWVKKTSCFGGVDTANGVFMDPVSVLGLDVRFKLVKVPMAFMALIEASPTERLTFQVAKSPSFDVLAARLTKGKSVNHHPRLH
jgi:hypothetical protein